MNVRQFYALLSLAAMLLSPIDTTAQTDPAQHQARMLWEQAITAKGGRDALYRIDSLAMWYEETARNFLGIPVHRGHVEAVYVFPGKLWSWDDGLPAPFHLTLRLLNVSQNLRCTLYEGAAKPICGSTGPAGSSFDEGIKQVQYVYLMETKWVKPLPVNVTKGKNVDVLHTRFENKQIDYFLDRKTHLPIRVEVFYNQSQRPTLTVHLSDYGNVSGVQMPGKQKKAEIQFEINPSIDEAVFTVAPSIEKGPQAWRKR